MWHYESKVEVCEKSIHHTCHQGKETRGKGVLKQQYREIFRQSLLNVFLHMS